MRRTLEGVDLARQERPERSEAQRSVWNMAEGISNGLLEEIYETAKRSGATGGKISGAGGGGFMIFYCPGTTKYHVIKKLEKFGGRHRRYQFVEHGLTTWTI